MGNWLRFKGEHHLRIEPKAYAVVARHERDADRSNFLGKTALVEAVRFAYFGEHRFRTEDEWITRGEKEGGVSVDHDDGFWVERRRARGGPTRLRARVGDGPIATGDEAQALVHKHLGLTLRDFDASAYLDQRSIARMVLADPSERMKIVEAWLELGPLKAAEAHNAKRLQQAADDVERESKRLLDLAQRRSSLRTPEVLQLAATGLRAAIAREQHGKAEAERGVELAKVQAAWLAKEEELAAVTREGKSLAAQLRGPTAAQLHVGIEARRPALTAEMGEHAQASRDEKAKRALAQGEFDGVCPVAGIACPAKDVINARRVENAALHTEAMKRATAAAAALNSEELVQQQMRSAEAARSRIEVQVAAVAKRAAALTDWMEAHQGAVTGDAVLDPDDERARAMACWERFVVAKKDLEAVGVEVATHETLDAQQERVQEALAEAEGRLTTHREAALVLGPRGAQRAVAEPFLQAIEVGANEALSEAGVELTVGIQWEHEGKDAAKACVACGQPFPASVKVKQCARCGAERGRSLLNRLDFSFSNRSAAAEDLWSIAMQLAACAWLRSGRSSSLEVGFFDEPWAHCDKSHRRALTKAFTSMLGRFGIRQAMLISHTPDHEAFQGRIEIVGHADGTSSVAVVR